MTRPKPRISSETVLISIIMVFVAAALALVALMVIGSFVHEDQETPLEIEQQMLDLKQECLDLGGKSEVNTGTMPWDKKFQGVTCEIYTEVGA